MSFKYDFTSMPECMEIVLSGSIIDKTQTSELLKEIDQLIYNVDEKIKVGHINILINMQDVDYINSLGITVLIAILTKARKSGGDVLLINIPDRVEKLLLMTKLSSVFVIVESLEEAKSKFNEAIS